jgi:hypothetical protein
VSCCFSHMNAGMMLFISSVVRLLTADGEEPASVLAHFLRDILLFACVSEGGAGYIDPFPKIEQKLNYCFSGGCSWCKDLTSLFIFKNVFFL